MDDDVQLSGTTFGKLFNKLMETLNSQCLSTGLFITIYYQKIIPILFFFFSFYFPSFLNLISPNTLNKN